MRLSPGSARIFEDETTISEDFRRRPVPVSEDVSNNSEVLKKMIMLHTDQKNSEILGKASSVTHLT